MRFGLPIFLMLILSGCSTAPDAELLEYRQTVQEKTSPRGVWDCKCPSLDPETGEYIGKLGPFIAAKGEFGGFPDRFNVIVDETSSFKVAVNKFASELSNKKTARETESGMTCWTDTCSPTTEYFISDLKDIRKTWVYLSARGKIYAHKCTFAEDPNLWTTEPCPSAKADLELSLRNSG